MIAGNNIAKLRGIFLLAAAALLANYLYIHSVFWALGKANSVLSNAGRVQGALIVVLIFWAPLLLTFLASRRTNLLSAWPKDVQDTLVTIVTGAATFAAFAIYIAQTFPACVQAYASWCSS